MINKELKEFFLKLFISLCKNYSSFKDIKKIMLDPIQIFQW